MVSCFGLSVVVSCILVPILSKLPTFHLFNVIHRDLLYFYRFSLSALMNSCINSWFPSIYVMGKPVVAVDLYSASLFLFLVSNEAVCSTSFVFYLVVSQEFPRLLWLFTGNKVFSVWIPPENIPTCCKLS